MPDITICVNKICPLRKQCYRYLVMPGRYQSYSHFTYNVEENSCENFVPILKGDRVIKEKQERKVSNNE